jgi:gliding motility-associated-like protein
VFTPGNDGKNDEYLVDIFNYREFRLQIFNRWGERIFETEDPSVGWNGNDINGKQLPSSTYYYILDYAFTCDEDTSRVEGIVEMIRER